jgi:hypothetical protein
MTLFDLNYAYCLKTESLFEDGNPTVFFDVYVFHRDQKLIEFNVFENVWRETLLL